MPGGQERGGGKHLPLRENGIRHSRRGSPGDGWEEGLEILQGQKGGKIALGSREGLGGKEELESRRCYSPCAIYNSPILAKKGYIKFQKSYSRKAIKKKKAGGARGTEAMANTPNKELSPA